MSQNAFPYKIFLLILILSGFLTSCITSKKINYLQESSYKIPQYNDSVGYKEYEITKGDRLYIRILSSDKKMKHFSTAHRKE